MKCFVLFVYVCVCRAHKLADSEKDIQRIKYPSLKSQKLTQDMKWNVNMSSNYERPVFSRLNEIATIKFNTGVSIFTKNVNLISLAWV